MTNQQVPIRLVLTSLEVFKVVDLVSVLQESLKEVNSKSHGTAKARKSAA